MNAQTFNPTQYGVGLVGAGTRVLGLYRLYTMFGACVCNGASVRLRNSCTQPAFKRPHPAAIRSAPRLATLRRGFAKKRSRKMPAPDLKRGVRFHFGLWRPSQIDLYRAFGPPTHKSVARIDKTAVQDPPRPRVGKPMVTCRQRGLGVTR